MRAMYDCGKEVFVDGWMCSASADYKMDIVGSLLVLLTVN